MDKPDDESFDINLVRQGPLFHYQRRFWLIKSDHDLSIGRRIGIAVLITWVPIILFALLQGKLFDHTDPLMRHFGVHSRCLIAIPLLIVAEGLAQTFMPMIVGEFVKSGLVRQEQIPAFHISEHALDGWEFDRVIKNAGSLDDLVELVAEAME